MSAKIVNEDGSLFTGVVMINGYDFGSRLLEDVMFHADAMDGVVDLKTVRIAPDAAAYFADLNQKKWLKEARDCFSGEKGYFELEAEAGEVWFEPDDESTVEPQPMQMESLGDLIGGKK